MGHHIEILQGCKDVKHNFSLTLFQLRYNLYPYSNAYCRWQVLTLSNTTPIMTNQDTIDLYVKAVDLAKQKDGLENKDKMILNKFKLILLSGAESDADREMAQIGKVRKRTLHRLRELAESIFEDHIRNCKITDMERDMALDEGKKRADYAEEYLLKTLKI